MFWTIAIAFAVIYGLNTILGLRQMKNFASEFRALRIRGRVAIGKKKGLLTAGAIVMFLLDEEGFIRDGRRLAGVSVLARFRQFDGFNGQTLLDVDASGDRRWTKSLRQAVDNARDNYRIVTDGGTAPDPLSPLAQLGASVKKIRRRPAAA